MYFTPFSKVSIANCEQANVSWEGIRIKSTFQLTITFANSRFAENRAYVILIFAGEKKPLVQ